MCDGSEILTRTLYNAKYEYICETMEYTANVHVCVGENDEKKEKNHTENSINSINSLLLLCASQRRQTKQRKGERKKNATPKITTLFVVSITTLTHYC